MLNAILLSSLLLFATLMVRGRLMGKKMKTYLPLREKPALIAGFFIPGRAQKTKKKV